MSQQEKPLVNRVAQSGLITLNLENYYPESPIQEFDIKPYLFKELLLKEKEFRAAMKDHDWSQYEGAHLVTFCSSNAIVPVWAYMLIASYAAPYAQSIFQGTKEAFLSFWYQQELAQLKVDQYAGQRLVIKGCSDKPVPPSAYTELTRLLQPLAKSIMYGEPCSTVPIYKQPRDWKRN
jgi:hypothetical protein